MGRRLTGGPKPKAGTIWQRRWRKKRAHDAAHRWRHRPPREVFHSLMKRPRGKRRIWA